MPRDGSGYRERRVGGSEPWNATPFDLKPEDRTAFGGSLAKKSE
jgi:hypothetical protein